MEARFMKKNQIIILALVIVLIFGGIIGWFLVQKSKIPLKEVFDLSGIVSSVDAENNFLMVKPAGEEKEIKVVLSDDTKLIKIEFPFDPANPPAETNFAPFKTEIEISDFKSGDNVFIKVTENIAGKTELDNVDFIHLLP
jgi:hypothetical protein